MVKADEPAPPGTDTDELPAAAEDWQVDPLSGFPAEAEVAAAAARSQTLRRLGYVGGVALLVDRKSVV